MVDLASRTWPEVRDRKRWVGLLPIGAIEAHGPHLPLATDGWIAEAMSVSAVERLRQAGLDTLILPTHHYTPAGFAAGFAGTVNAQPEVVEGVIAASAKAVGHAGGELLVVVNAHFDPANITAIRAGVESASQDSGAAPVLFFDLTRRHHAERIGGEFATGACHAGRYEGSLMLAIRPDLVDSEAAVELEPYPRSLAEAIRTGARSFEELGGDQGYFGWPADASATEGEATLDLIGEMLFEEVQSALAGSSAE